MCYTTTVMQDEVYTFSSRPVLGAARHVAADRRLGLVANLPFNWIILSALVAHPVRFNDRLRYYTHGMV